MARLDRTRFEYLYLNANSIADIALLRALDKAASAAAERTPEQRAAVAALAHDIANPDPATFDWSALEGVYGFDGPLDAAPPAGAGPGPADAVRLPSFDQMVGVDDEDLDAPLDIAHYLRRVDDARPALQARVDDCFARADIAAFEAVLATLPTDRAPPDSALAPEDFTGWLELYEARHGGIEAIVHGIRQLEPLAAA
jgi:hypothetical protein